MEQRDNTTSRVTPWLRDALISFGAVLLAFGALDDITTDNAQSFTVERIALACCGGWFVFLSVRLWQARHRLIAIISLGAVGLAAWAQPLIGPGTVPSGLAYLATIAALVWFLFVAVFLAWRPTNRQNAAV